MPCILRYFTYDTFVQEENLPQLDLQELLDNAMDIKLTQLSSMASLFGAETNIVAQAMHQTAGIVTDMLLMPGKLSHEGPCERPRLLDDILFVSWF